MAFTQERMVAAHILPSRRRGRREPGRGPGDGAGPGVVRSAVRACRTRAHRRRSEGGVPGGRPAWRSPRSSRAAPCPFGTLCGVSAGGLNAAFLGAWRGDFEDAGHRLRELWLELSPERVFRTDGARMIGIGTPLDARPLGGRPLPAQPHQLPARRHAAARLPPRAAPARRPAAQHRLGRHPRLRGHRHQLRHQRGGDLLRRRRRTSSPGCGPRAWGCATQIRLDHVMASASIPIFFPPVRIQGAWYGDGSVRMTAPLSPAIHMGAERLLVIGRAPLAGAVRAPAGCAARPGATPSPPSQIAGTLLNAVFLETIEADVERLEMVNRLVDRLPPARSRRGTLRVIPTLVLRPSRDLGQLAGDQYRRFPRFLRYVLSGIGAQAENGLRPAQLPGLRAGLRGAAPRAGLRGHAGPPRRARGVLRRGAAREGRPARLGAPPAVTFARRQPRIDAAMSWAISVTSALVAATAASVPGPDDVCAAGPPGRAPRPARPLAGEDRPVGLQAGPPRMRSSPARSPRRPRGRGAGPSGPRAGAAPASRGGATSSSWASTRETPAPSGSAQRLNSSRSTELSPRKVTICGRSR